MHLTQQGYLAYLRKSQLTLLDTEVLPVDTIASQLLDLNVVKRRRHRISTSSPVPHNQAPPLYRSFPLTLHRRRQHPVEEKKAAPPKQAQIPPISLPPVTPIPPPQSVSNFVLGMNPMPASSAYPAGPFFGVQYMPMQAFMGYHYPQFCVPFAFSQPMPGPQGVAYVTAPTKPDGRTEPGKKCPSRRPETS